MTDLEKPVATPTLPGLLSLRWRDRTIQRAFNTAAFMVIVAAGFRWAAPSGAPPPGVDLSFEIAMAKWVPVGALIIAALASFVLARRYAWLKDVVSRGVVIQGVVEDLDVFEREGSHSDTTPAFQRARIRTHYATIRYSCLGEERKARLWLPGSPSRYRLFKGKETDLIVLESAPHRPLIRRVYLGRF